MKPAIPRLPSHSLSNPPLALAAQSIAACANLPSPSYEMETPSIFLRYAMMQEPIFQPRLFLRRDMG